MAKMKLPYSLLNLNDKDREEILTVLLEASGLPKTKQLPFRGGGDEHNIWERNLDPLQADIEDELYKEMIDAELETLMDLFEALGLPIEDFEKSLDPFYMAWEDELIKAKDSGRNRMTEHIRRLAEISKKRAQQFIQWTTNGKPLPKPDIKKVETILARKLPKFAERAEDFMVRAGFIGKIRGEAEQQGFEDVGVFIDRYPSTVEAARKESVVLTKRHAEKERKAGNKVKILPLTEREADAVEHAAHHAGDKLTEISVKHQAAIRQLVMQAKKERWTVQQLASKLFDKFGDHNRDWRRVAITELSFATNDAYLAGLTEGETVVGMGAENACKHCKKYVIGKTFIVTHKPPMNDTYEGDMKMVWSGKSNYGRRVAEFRPAVPMHPNCRCRWHRISRFYKLGDNGKLELKSTAELIQEERAKRGMAPDEDLMRPSAVGAIPVSQEELARKAEDLLRKLGG